MPNFQSNKNNSNLKRFNKLIKSIDYKININDLDGALTDLNLALNIECNNYLILNEIGNCYAKKGDFSLALDYHNKAASINSENAIILCNIGLDLLKLDRIEESIQFFNFAIEIDNQYYMPYSGLTTAYHNSGDINSLYKLSIKAIEIFPDKYDFHLNLGISLIYLEKYEEALYCIETALILNPNCIEAKINKAAAYSKMNKRAEAIDIYEEILETLVNSDNSIKNSIKFNLSFEYLYQGRLKEGWSFYEYGFEESIPFNQRRKPFRLFKSPRWSGEKLNGSTLMVWREQGLGDELLFLSMIPDLLLIVDNLIIECDPRLIQIIKHSFPNVLVREPIFLESEDYDFQIPLGSLASHLRNKIEDFNNSKKYLIPIKSENVDINNFFQKNADKIIIGICWRSGLLNNQRNNNYISLNDWGSIFEIQNAIFVNLQYGDCENEILEAEDKFKISIQRWRDIDMKNDLNTVFRIIDGVDYVVTAATAVSSMAYSTGKTSLVFQPSRNWTNLGTNYYPWSNSMIQFTPEYNHPLSSTLDQISKYILKYTKK
jgi:tetratricopeptide (TPR) repeat protein